MKHRSFRKKTSAAGSAHEMVSKRLVEYFLVYSCKPKKRNKEKENVHLDDSVDKSSSSNSAQKQSNSDRSRSTRSNGDGKDATSTEHLASTANHHQSIRAAARAVHLHVASDGGILGNSESGEQNKIHNLPSQDSFFDEGITPLVSNGRKSINISNSANQQSSILDMGSNSSNEVEEQEGINYAPSFRGIRIPVTEDTGTDEDGATSTDADTDINGGGEYGEGGSLIEDIPIRPSTSIEPVTTPIRSRKGIDKVNDSDGDALMTPSRARDDDCMTPSRARAELDSSEDDSDTDTEAGGTVSPMTSSPQNQLNGNNFATNTTTKGEPENVHLPRTNSAQDNGASHPKDTLAAEYSLEPIKTAQYPLQDRPDCPLNPMVSHFCFPQVLSLTTEYQMPRIHYFVLTNDKGTKLYGTCLTVWETYEEGSGGVVGDDEWMELSALVKTKANIKTAADNQEQVEVSLSYDKTEIYIPKVLCILSYWPYLHSFREYLAQLYRLATMTNLMEVPIERHVMNICDEAPAPPPGIFELRLKIFSSTLKFWGPPGGQPLAYVALPFKVLFECLDLNNVVFVWYALTLERKVLLVSSKYSLITTCAEILCSLLFPMRWSHLYVPYLPRFLSPMLDAPMPYLCGISRENLSHAVGDISDETIVVDLDQNLITMGHNSESFPPLPLKRRSKLEKVLQQNVGNVFWEARGLNREDIMNTNGEIVESDKLMKTADRVWKERLRGYDDVFNLAFTPDSETLMNDESRGTFGVGRGDGFQQSTWDSVQEAFLRFYVTMLRDYKRFIVEDNNGSKIFKTKEFILAQRADHRFFLREFCSTQQFDCFLTKRMYEPGAPDILFFDQSITAKRNRSKMTLKKKETPFLMSAKARQGLRSVEVPQPTDDASIGSNLMDQMYASSSTKKTFMYKNWPETFDTALFTSPKPIPSEIAAEFARIENVSKVFGKKMSDSDDSDFRPGKSHASIEVATFTVFFTVYCKIVGTKFELLRNQHNRTQSRSDNIASVIQRNVETEIRESLSKSESRSVDCGTTNICSPCSGSTVSAATITDESVATLRPLQPLMAKAEFDTDMEAAQLLANRQLDLAFSVMETMSMRSLPSDQDALKSLMEACGRCGATSRATQLITMMKEQYLIVDSLIYSNYLTAFTVANEINPDEPIKSPLTNVPLRVFDPSVIKVEATKPRWFGRSKKGKTRSRPGSADQSISAHESLSRSETSSVSARSEPPSSPQKTARNTPPSQKRSIKRNPLVTTDTIERNLIMGECLLKDDLYSGIEIDDKGDSCPQCSAFLTSEQLMTGWSSCAFSEYRTKCLHCKNEFIPRFIVKSKSPDFVGSQGPGSQLYCEFFSPWVIQRELHLATNGGNDMDAILDPNKRVDHNFNTKLWWNMLVLFRKQKLPFTFLLQGYFPGNLTV